MFLREMASEGVQIRVTPGSDALIVVTVGHGATHHDREYLR